MSGATTFSHTSVQAALMHKCVVAHPNSRGVCQQCCVYTLFDGDKVTKRVGLEHSTNSLRVGVFWVIENKSKIC